MITDQMIEDAADAYIKENTGGFFLEGFSAELWKGFRDIYVANARHLLSHVYRPASPPAPRAARIAPESHAITEESK